MHTVLAARTHIPVPLANAATSPPNCTSTLAISGPWGARAARGFGFEWKGEEGLGVPAWLQEPCLRSPRARLGTAGMLWGSLRLAVDFSFHMLYFSILESAFGSLL